MTHCDFGHGHRQHWLGTQSNDGTDTATASRDLVDSLSAAQEPAGADALADLSFAVLLIEKLEAVHKADPEADVSLSLRGKWIASFETVRMPDEDHAQDEAA